MSYIGTNPESYDGTVVGNGQCVAFVRTCSGAPATATWTMGSKVKTATIAKHTAIATFDENGQYPNNPTGQHAAIFISKDEKGITVWDQWSGQPVHTRVIKYKGGVGSWSNDADRFSIIEGPTKTVEALVESIENETAACVNLAALPLSAFGKTSIDIRAAGFDAQLHTLDHTHTPTPSQLVEVPLRETVEVGLGGFQYLSINLNAPNSSILEVVIHIVSSAGAITRLRAIDTDGDLISDHAYSTPQAELASIIVRGIGIGRIEFPNSSEVTILRLSVKSLPRQSTDAGSEEQKSDPHN